MNFGKMKRVFLFLSLTLIGLNLEAQSYDESMRYWHEGPLVWDDLTLKSPRDFRTSDLHFRWLTTTEKTRPAWNTVRYVSIPSVALDKSISWHNMERLYPCALAYDQVLFDLNELYFRKMLNEMYSKENTRSSQALYSFYSDQSRGRWNEIYEETNDGLDSAMVAYHAAKIAEELAAVNYPEMNKTQRYFLLGYNVGYSNSRFFGAAAETFGTAHGVMLDMTMGFKMHEFSMLLSAGTGALLKDVDFNGTIREKGKNYNHGYIGLTYGYRVYDGTFFSLKPFVGVGGRMLTPLNEGNGENKAKGFSDTVVLGGAEMHFKFWRSLQQNAGIENCLGLRAFVARDFGASQAFSLNLGVFYAIDMPYYQ